MCKQHADMKLLCEGYYALSVERDVLELQREERLDMRRVPALTMPLVVPASAAQIVACPACKDNNARRKQEWRFPAASVRCPENTSEATQKAPSSRRKCGGQHHRSNTQPLLFFHNDVGEVDQRMAASTPSKHQSPGATNVIGVCTRGP